jgi:hypothetical protein
VTKPKWEVRQEVGLSTKKELLVDGRVVTSWDTVEHPNWPPVDSNGELIGDVPWKFFDP